MPPKGYKKSCLLFNFLDRISVAGENECWHWKGYVRPHAVGQLAYGTISYAYAGDCTAFYAHRLSYEFNVGPIPDGWHIDHLCRNPTCVNPRHLEAVPQIVNWERGMSGIRQQSLQTHCKNGHPFDDDNTLHTVNPNGRPGRVCKTCRIAWTNKNRWRYRIGDRIRYYQEKKALKNA